ncbi:hypothetical protein [Cystobacter ferrugineus]|uniref:Lipoprotein n=1 Tax=Cystobacter ferrugineus TaxID=83449 RepID=A0A1L9BDA8_9BACT|nr:hypothetical protein [Cystobacter ferrugineus]OJH40206.1 hypothetical protein BON30_14235 [Cystobacter ferrugineus]
MLRVLMSLALCGVLSGCGTQEDEPMRQGRLALRTGQSVSGKPECGVDLPACAEGTSCVAFKLDGVTQARCVNEETLCTDLLTCTGGTECAILTSFPAQVLCSGRCEGNDCDTPVSNSAP